MGLEIMNAISAREAAEILGVTLGRIRQLLAESKIRGEKLTPRAWAIDKKSVVAYARTDRRRGPKRVA